MPEAPRFHLDEDMPFAVARGLHRRERECSTTQDTSLMGASDAEQLAHAKREGRVLITRDHDFARMHTTDQDHAGIILWTQNCHFGQLIKDIDALCFEMSAEDFRGRLLFL